MSDMIIRIPADKAERLLHNARYAQALLADDGHDKHGAIRELHGTIGEIVEPHIAGEAPKEGMPELAEYVEKLEAQVKRFALWAWAVNRFDEATADERVPLDQADWDFAMIEGMNAQEEDEEDDDPQCVCGTYRSEHAMMGCPEGFQTPKGWEHEKALIAEMDDDEFERVYHPYG